VTSELDAVAADLTARMPRLMDELDIPGLAIGIVHGPDSWAAGFGSTRRGGGTQVTASTIFSLQSVSETFAALTVLAGVRDGVLGLEDTVARRLPEFTVHSRLEMRPQDAMTVRHLLSHRAGFTHEAPVGSNYCVGPESFEEHVRSICDTWLRYPVGVRYAYSNLGIDLAGYLVARQRATDFATCARDSVLGPLGMSRSSFDLAQIEATADRAIGHAGPGAPPVPVKIPMLAAGGMYASVRDLVTFLHAELDSRVLPPPLIEQMRAVPIRLPGQAGGYGLGLALISGPGWTVYGHSGGGFGFLTDLYWEPAAGTGIAVLTNDTQHPLQQALALGLLARLAGRDPASALGATQATGTPVPAAGYRQYRGEYAGHGLGLDLVEQDGLMGVRTQLAQFTPIALADAGDLLVELPGQPVPMRLRPLAATDSAPRLISLLDGSALDYNSAPQPPAPKAAAIAARDAIRYAGDYVLGDGTGPVTHRARLALAAGRLWLASPELTGLPRLRLDPYEPAAGMYFSVTGEALDLHADPPRYASIQLVRQT
jgi:CubicO group peptidase (beta-lactamase class C family)